MESYKLLRKLFTEAIEEISLKQVEAEMDGGYGIYGGGVTRDLGGMRGSAIASPTMRCYSPSSRFFPIPLSES